MDYDSVQLFYENRHIVPIWKAGPLSGCFAIDRRRLTRSGSETPTSRSARPTGTLRSPLNPFVDLGEGKRELWLETIIRIQDHVDHLPHFGF